jgi:hypothetical protein
MTPSGIAERQNMPKNIRLLAAQRQLYSEEKKRTGIWYLASLVVITVHFAASSAFADIESYEPLIVVFWLLVAIGELGLLPFLRQPRIEAATIQEQFDCDVLDLEWNDALTEKPDPKIVERATERFDRRKNPDQEWKKLENWYESPSIQTEPIHVARITCIKENVRWDSGQRREWVRWIIAITIGIAIILVIGGIRCDWLMKQYFSGLFLLVIPPLVAVATHIQRHLDAANRLDRLKGVLENLRLDALLEHVDIEVIERRTRYLQTEICRHRMEDVPVLDWFYNLLGKKYAPARVEGRVEGMSSAQQ